VVLCQSGSLLASELRRQVGELLSLLLLPMHGASTAAAAQASCASVLLALAPVPLHAVAHKQLHRWGALLAGGMGAEAGAGGGAVAEAPGGQDAGAGAAPSAARHQAVLLPPLAPEAAQQQQLAPDPLSPAEERQEEEDAALAEQDGEQDAAAEPGGARVLRPEAQAFVPVTRSV
jgi:hypothetical protein